VTASFSVCQDCPTAEALHSSQVEPFFVHIALDPVQNTQCWVPPDLQILWPDSKPPEDKADGDG